MQNAISAITDDKSGVLRDIAEVVASQRANIKYTHQFIINKGRNKGFAHVYMEIEKLKNIQTLINELEELESIHEISKSPKFQEVYGKRIIVMGGGAQVAEVAKGAISEADRHNIRGEKISVDTIPLVGEKNLAEAVGAVKRLHRAEVLVLAGALIGGEITEVVEEVRKEGVKVISLKNIGSAKKSADLVVSDPTLAGILSVMATSERGSFDISRVRGKTI